MKNRFILLFSFFSLFVFSQNEKSYTSLEAHYFYGYILEHNPNIAHLITHRPEGLLLKYNNRTFGEQAWQARHNYPDWGFSVAYQNMKNEHLGELFSVYSHINWYVANRNIQLSVGQGVAYATKPYHPENNYQNSVYGSSFLSSTFLAVNYHKPNLFHNLGVQAGVSLFHYSNGNLKAPNTSTNTLAVNIGLQYDFNADNTPVFIEHEKENYTEPIHFNALLRFGINESDVIGMGQRPFVVVSAFADKRFSKTSSVYAGAELFLSYFLQDLIAYRAAAYPEDALSGNEDFKRVGIFVGYEMRINKIAPFVDLGYYVYYPYDFEGRFYNRLGIKRYFGSGQNIYGTVNVKAHAAKAEAVEFGVGFRF